MRWLFVGFEGEGEEDKEEEGEGPAAPGKEGSNSTAHSGPLASSPTPPRYAAHAASHRPKAPMDFFSTGL